MEQEGYAARGHSGLGMRDTAGYGGRGLGLLQLGGQSLGDCTVEIRLRSCPLTLPSQDPAEPSATHPRCPPYPPQPGVLHGDLSEEEVDMVSMLQGMDEVWL